MRIHYFISNFKIYKVDFFFFEGYKVMKLLMIWCEPIRVTYLCIDRQY